MTDFLAKSCSVFTVGRIWFQICTASCAPILFAIEGDSIPTKPSEIAPLSPEQTAKFSELLKSIEGAAKPFLQTRMQTEAAYVGRLSKLSPESSKIIQKAADAVSEAVFEEKRHFLEEKLRSVLREIPDVTVDGFFQRIAMRRENVIFLPDQSPQWKAALQANLTPEQFLLWERSEEEQHKALSKAIEAGEKQARTQLESSKPLMVNIEKYLDLPEDRLEKLISLHKEANELTLAKFGKEMGTSILGLPREMRGDFLKRGASPFGNATPSLSPDSRKLWDAGIENILSADEILVLKKASEESVRNRIHFMAQAMVAQMDITICLSSAQRKQMEILCQQLVQNEPALGASAEVSFDGESDQRNFFNLAAKLNETQLRSFLDNNQISYWREFCSSGSQPKTDKPKDENLHHSPQLAFPEPEEREHAISEFLIEKSEGKRAKLQQSILHDVEDVIRITNLDPPQASRLRTAALGAIESSLQSWRSNLEANTRMFLQQDGNTDIRRKLASMQDWQFNRGFSLPKNQDVWQKSIAAELTQGQLSLWKECTQERETYLATSIANLQLLEFDKTVGIKPAQWPKLEALLIKTIQEYGPDIDTMFVGDNTPWYLRVYTRYIPFAAISEATMKEVLSKPQWDRWRACQLFEIANSNWENVRQSHDQRVKAKNP